MKTQFLAIAVLVHGFVSCTNKTGENKKDPEIKKDQPVSKAKKNESEPPRAPIINMTDSLSVKSTVLYMKDSAATRERIGVKLGNIYGVKLAAFIKKNKLKIIGKPMAWYNSTKAPYFFAAGVPVEKKPAKQPSTIYVREIGVDSVVVAHFYGPYNLLPQAYEALRDWIKSHKKTLKEKPYEIYVDDPMDKEGKMKDPYKVQTDVVFPWK